MCGLPFATPKKLELHSALALMIAGQMIAALFLDHYGAILTQFRHQSGLQELYWSCWVFHGDK